MAGIDAPLGIRLDAAVGRSCAEAKSKRNRSGSCTTVSSPTWTTPKLSDTRSGSSEA